MKRRRGVLARLKSVEKDKVARFSADSEVKAAIEENLRTVHYGHELASAGITTVALDERDRLVEHHPDGSTSVVDTLAAHHD
jgi:hypothetical protein